MGMFLLNQITYSFCLLFYIWVEISGYIYWLGFLFLNMDKNYFSIFFSAIELLDMVLHYFKSISSISFMLHITTSITNESEI